MEQKEKEFCSKLFDLSSSPNLTELKKKYRNLIKEYHPDRHPNRIEWSTKIVQRLNEAYEILLQHLLRFLGPQRDDKEKQVRTVISKERIEKIITIGDDAIRNAVIIGWLKRTPKDSFAISARNKVKESLYALQLCPGVFTDAKILFFRDLFSVFLKATDSKTFLILPHVWNTTSFFRQLGIANVYLDSGIRDYYRFSEEGNISKFANIPLSFFKDSIRVYNWLVKDTGGSIKSQINTRIELAQLYEIRIKRIIAKII